MSRNQTLCSLGALFLAGFPGPSTAQSGAPTGLSQARSAYEREFVREVNPLQEKYRRALEQHQRSYTRSGDLGAALEARAEVKRVNRWETVPREVGKRSLKDPQLNKLLQGYERAVVHTYQPVVKRYETELTRLKGSLAAAGLLDDSVKVDAELSKVKSGDALPLDVGARAYFSTFTKSDFAQWLTEQVFEFTGQVAGLTRVTMDGKTLNYDSRQVPVEYPYKVTGLRELVIDEGRFSMKFSKDLFEATFVSVRAEYPVTINPDLE